MEGQNVKTSSFSHSAPRTKRDFAESASVLMASELSMLTHQLGQSMSGLIGQMRQQLQDLEPAARTHPSHFGAIADACDELWRISLELQEPDPADRRSARINENAICCSGDVKL